jgi:hypothetical protein
MEPFGTTVQLSCGVVENSTGLQWMIMIPNDLSGGTQRTRSTNDPESTLLSFNIRVVNRSELVLQLDVTGSEVNNGIEFICQVFTEAGDLCVSDLLRVIFFGM